MPLLFRFLGLLCGFYLFPQDFRADLVMLRSLDLNQDVVFDRTYVANMNGCPLDAMIFAAFVFVKSFLQFAG